MRRFAGFVLLAFLAALSLACVKKESQGKLNVVVTIPPLADLVRGVAGERVQVTTLLPPGASPHTFEPTPSLAKAASEASLAVRVGLELDEWVTGLLPQKIMTITAGKIKGIELTTDEEGAGPNPHIWLDPVIAKLIVNTVADSLIRIDPGGKVLYESGRDRYLASLDSLDSRIRDAVFSFKTKGYVSFHPAWAYFGRRYGLRSVAVIAESPGKEPTPKHLEAVVQAIRNTGLRAVFAEPQFSPKAAEVIAEEAGVKVLVLDPLGGQNESYIQLIQRNLAVMAQAMGGK